MANENSHPTQTRLSRDLIVEAALELAATPGAADLSFRALGRALGVDHTAIYRHFPNKEALMSTLIDRLIAQVGNLLPDDPSGGWREYLYSGAIAFHDVFLEHPSLAVRAMAVRDVGPAELWLLDRVIAALSMAGLSGSSLLTHYGAYSSLLLSFTAMAAQEQLAVQDPVDSIGWVPTAVPMTALSHPHLFPLWTELSVMNFRDTYIAGLTVILDAIEAAARHGNDHPQH